MPFARPIRTNMSDNGCRISGAVSRTISSVASGYRAGRYLANCFGVNTWEGLIRENPAYCLIIEMQETSHNLCNHWCPGRDILALALSAQSVEVFDYLKTETIRSVVREFATSYICATHGIKRSAT